MTARYVLDSNIVIALLRSDPKAIQAVAHAAAVNADLWLCPVVFYETLRGLLYRDAKRQAQTFLSYAAAMTWDDLTQADWQEAARLWAELRRQGRQVADADLLIGVYALQRQAIVVTTNEKHFASLGAQTEDWLK